MLDFVIATYFPDIWAAHGAKGGTLQQRQDAYLAFYRRAPCSGQAAGAARPLRNAPRNGRLLG
jgi:hypothetical protein